MVGDTRSDLTALATDFRALTEQLARTDDDAGILNQMVMLARTTLPGCDRAGVTQVAARRKLRTVAATDPVVREVDELQYQLREGPCVTATGDDGVFLADDLTRDHRWPGFSARAAAESPVRSVLALTISRSAPQTALNLYSSRPGVFTPDRVDTAIVFAAHARLLMMNIDSADKVHNLSQALTTSRLIGTAIGILMFAHKIGEDEAFDRLIRASQNLNRKLSEIAKEVARTGALPHREPTS